MSTKNKNNVKKIYYADKCCSRKARTILLSSDLHMTNEIINPEKEELLVQDDEANDETIFYWRNLIQILREKFNCLPNQKVIVSDYYSPVIV